MKKTIFESVDAYINSFPLEVQSILHDLRSVILKTAPDAIENIAYGMPAYKLNKKPLVYFAGYKKHVGFYATPMGHAEFAKKLSMYKQGKGSVQFPLDQTLPLKLVEQIVKFRVKENNQKKQ